MSAGFLAVFHKALALTKLSLMKTAGVVGDDLALNAKQVSHVPPERELPVVWEVAKGSMKNKVILSTAGIILSATIPQVIFPLLMVGGAYFCHEGVEKLYENWQHRKEHPKLNAAGQEDHYDENLPAETEVEEKERIRDAIRTDFVLSAEIVVLTLGMVSGADGSYLTKLATQATALGLSAPIMTGLVYGSVAGLVKIDDVGEKLKKNDNKPLYHLGNVMMKAAPWILKGLTIAGTVAMFTVGGGLLVEGFAPLHHIAEHFSEIAGSVPYVGKVLEFAASNAAGGITGVIAGIGTVSAAHGLKATYERVKNAFGFRKKAESNFDDGKPDDNAPAPELTPAEPDLSVKPSPDQETKAPKAGSSFTQAASPPIVVPPDVTNSFGQAAKNDADDPSTEVAPEQIPPKPSDPGAGRQPN